MLRHCAQFSRRHRRPRRQHWPSPSAAAPWDRPDDDARGTGAPGPSARRGAASVSATVAAAPAVVRLRHRPRHRPPPPPHQKRRHPVAFDATRRHFGISRHPDPLAKHGTINTLEDEGDGALAAGGDGGFDDGDDGAPVTADDLDYDENVLSRRMSEEGPAGVHDDDDDDAAGERAADDYSDIFGAGGLFGHDDDDDADDAAGDGDGDGEAAGTESAFLKRQAEIKAGLDKRTGRLWDDEWIITDEEWSTDQSLEDIEEWHPRNATRRSLESVRVWDGIERAARAGGRGGVPTLGELAGLELPPPLPPHPGQGEPGIYAKFRKRRLKARLQTAIQVSIHDDLKKILDMESWGEKQDAVDELFEVVAERVKEREPILGKLPEFENMVEKGLEEVLTMVHSRMRGAEKERNRRANAKKKLEKAEKAEEADDAEEGEGGGEGRGDVVAAADGGEEVEGKGGASSGREPFENPEELIDVMGVNAEPPTPVFADILAAANQLKERQRQPSDDADDAASPPPMTALSPFFAESNDAGVPNLVYPLNVSHRDDAVGRMVEEWQLAANKETKRIMLRDCTREIARRVVESANCCEGMEGGKGSARVFVTGQRGAGKTAALAGIVASARLSGHIVVYLPDGDRLRRQGFYVEPCNHRKGMYNLPEIAKEFCEQLLTTNGDDVAAMPPVTKEDMKDFFTEDQVKRLFRRAYKEDESVSEEDVAAMTELSLDNLLSVGIGSSNLSSGCYSTVIDALMKQTQKPFTVVMDEFNCYYDHGHYFHMDYDFHVRKGIPLNRITILKPFLDAMGLYPGEAGTDMSGGEVPAPPPEEAAMKWGSVIAATSESRAVRGSFTRSLAAAAHAEAARKGDEGRSPLHVVDVRRFSDVEVQHALYNFEIAGVGRLRFDRGDTALNPEEVEYLRLVSGGSGQRLLDSCMIRI